MTDLTHPPGHSLWRHREKGGEYMALTVAAGTGPDHGEQFVYYLGREGEGTGKALVRRLEDWHAKMEPLQPGGDDDLDELI